MKKDHAHHTKKKSAKNHSSKAKLRRLSNFTDSKTKIHTRTKAVTAKKRKERLELSALKLPHKKLYDKQEIIRALCLDHHPISKKNIKLILNKVKGLTDEDLEEYRRQQIDLSTLINQIIS